MPWCSVTAPHCGHMVANGTWSECNTTVAKQINYLTDRQHNEKLLLKAGISILSENKSLSR